LKLRNEGGFDLFQLKDACFDATDLKNAGYTTIQLRCGGFDAGQLREAGFDIHQISAAGFDHRKLRLGGFQAHDLRHDLLCDERQLKDAGFSATDLKGCAFHASELKAIGYTPLQMMECYTAEQLGRAGFTKADLKPIGAWIHDGQWQSYNHYWNCCFSVDKASLFCEPSSANSNTSNTSRNSFTVKNNANLLSGVTSPK